jgi:hypothetical protein
MKTKPKASRRTTPQLSIRSEYAYRRARELSRQAGTTATQIVEDALRAYSPPEADREAALQKRREDLQAIIDQVPKDGPYPSIKEIEDEMYDEWGVPR